MSRLGRLARLALLLAIILAGFVLGSPRARGDDTSVLASRVHDLLSLRCYRCHGQNNVASKNVFVLDRKRLVDSGVVVPGDQASLILRVVESGLMPMGGPELSQEEKQTLRNWVAAGAPDWVTGALQPRGKVSIDDLNRLMLADIARVPERSRQFVRYFSLTHLWNAGAPTSELEVTAAALSKLVNSLSWHPQLTPPLQADSRGVLFRIDLRDYNWTAQTWNSLVAFYPYSIRTPETVRLAQMTGAEVSCLRADWFVASASVPPLYYDVLELPRTTTELERRLGVDVARNLAEEKNVARAGIRTSGVSQNNRVVERHVSATGAYWKSYDFRNNLDGQNIFQDPVSLRPAGGEIIFNLPNGLQAYFLADGRGVRLDRAPIDIVSDRNNPEDPTIQSGRSCITCHFAGMKDLKDDVRLTLSRRQSAPFDLTKAIALYPDQRVLDGLTQRDGARFAGAIAELNISPVTGATSEPIAQVARRFERDLSINEAAAEVGIDMSAFQADVSTSKRLSIFGFGQLVVPGGGIKRDAWERHFRDLVEEFQLGEPISGREFLARGESVWNTRRQMTLGEVAAKAAVAAIGLRSPQAAVLINQTRINSTSSTAATPAGGLTQAQADAVRAARTVFIMSRSAYFNPSDLAAALAKKSEWRRFGLTLTMNRSVADLIVSVDRLPFTTEFPFTVVDSRTGVLVFSGRVNSLFGTVAGKISSNLVKQLSSVLETRGSQF